MHVWVIEVKYSKDGKWNYDSTCLSREAARGSLEFFENYYSSYYKTRVVKYISTKGE